MRTAAAVAQTFSAKGFLVERAKRKVMEYFSIKYYVCSYIKAVTRFGNIFCLLPLFYPSYIFVVYDKPLHIGFDMHVVENIRFIINSFIYKKI